MSCPRLQALGLLPQLNRQRAGSFRQPGSIRPDSQHRRGERISRAESSVRGSLVRTFCSVAIPSLRGQAFDAAPCLNPLIQAQGVVHAAGGACFRLVNRREHVDRAEKRELVAELNGVFTKASVVVVAHYSGLTVAQLEKLRTQIRGAGASVQVAKNRLAKIALDGTDVASIGALMKGPTLIAYSDDPVAAPKVCAAFAKEHDKLVILGGAMGATPLNADGVKALATLPSLDELRAKIVGLVNAPATKIAQLSTAPAAKLARVFGAYANQDAA